MNASQIFYRVRQFWQALGKKPTNHDLELVKLVLTPSELLLFQRMDRGEQIHSIRVLRSLLEKGEHHPDLLKAALLHDVGKSCFPLHLWERVIIVLAKAIIPGWVERWGSKPVNIGQEVESWRRGFIVSEQHADWGAQMTAEVDASALVVKLIRHHQGKLPEDEITDHYLEQCLLRALRATDEES
jgi:hypothetical protein